MSARLPRAARLIQRALLRLLPARIRQVHRDAMEVAFSDALEDAKARGRGALFRVLLREVVDLLRVSLGARLGARAFREAGVVDSAAKRAGGLGMAMFTNDLRHGIRLWIRRPGFALLAVMTAAIGIAATTAMWTIADGVLYRPLPYAHANRLVMVWQTLQSMQGGTVPMSYPNISDIRAEKNTGFEEIAWYLSAPRTATVSTASEPEALRTALVSGQLFALLGRQAQLGRVLSEADDRLEAPRVVVLSHGFWQSRFGGEKSVLGRTVLIDGEPHEVVGVMPPRFAFPWPRLEMWVPLRMDPAEADRDLQFLNVIGRLGVGVTKEDAQRRTGAAMARLVAAYPGDNEGKGIRLDEYRELLVAPARSAMRVLLGAAAVLLLLACANLANLMLARSGGRRRELAVRSALGASRPRLIAQLVAENATFAVAGGVLGVLLARVCIVGLMALAPTSLPRRDEIFLDARALVFAAVATIVSGLLFAVLPALRASRSGLNAVLAEGPRGATTGGRHRGLRFLVVAQLAMALVLLSGSGLLLHSFARLAAVNPGFDAHGVYTLRVSLPETRYPEPENVNAFFETLVREANALPGVRTVGATWALPFTGAWASGRVTVEGKPKPHGEESVVGLMPVRGDYFQTMGIPLRAGRLLDDATDGSDEPGVVLINESAARQLWPGEDAVGKRFKRARADEDAPWITIAGVVADIKRFELDAEEVTIESYWHHSNSRWARDMVLVARAEGNPLALARPLRALVQRLDPELAVMDAGTLDERVHQSISAPRFRTVLVGTFAVLALLLSLIGTYGVMAFAVTERRHEIGVRMAIGAARARVVGDVLGDGVRLVAAGVLIGVPGALLGTRAITTMLFGVDPLDPLTHTIAVLILVVATLLACLVPALRASRVDPMVALRTD